MKMTKKKAVEIANQLDKIANLVQSEPEVLGLPPHIALDFARRCDLLSDRVEHTAGIRRSSNGELKMGADWNPNEIGLEDSGPLQQDSDENYLDNEFSQQEFRELREEQQSGNLPSPSMEEQSPRSGVQASFYDLSRAVISSSPRDKKKVAHILNLARKAIKESSC